MGLARGKHAKYVQANSGSDSWRDRDDRFADDAMDDWVSRGKHAKHAARPKPVSSIGDRDDDWVPRGRHARHARSAVSVSEPIPQHQATQEIERQVQQPIFEPEPERLVQQSLQDLEQLVRQSPQQQETQPPVSQQETPAPIDNPKLEFDPADEAAASGDSQSTSELPVSRKRFIDSAVQGQVMPDATVLNLDFLRQVSRSMTDKDANEAGGEVAVPFYVVPGQDQGAASFGVVPSGSAPSVIPGEAPFQDLGQAQGFVATDVPNAAFVSSEQPQKVNNWQLSRSMWSNEEKAEAEEQQGWAEVPQSRLKAFKLRREQEQAQEQNQAQAQAQAQAQDFAAQHASTYQVPHVNGGFGSHARIPQEGNNQQAWSPQAHASHVRASHARPEYESRPLYGKDVAAREFTIEGPQHDYSKVVAIVFSILMAAVIVSFSFFGAGHMKLPAGSTVTVKYDSRGGNSAHFSSGAMTTEVVHVGDTYGSGSFDDGDVHNAMPTTERNGYMFIGWYTEPTGGERVAASTEVTNTKDHTLYAHWR